MDKSAFQNRPRLTSITSIVLMIIISLEFISEAHEIQQNIEDSNRYLKRINEILGMNTNNSKNHLTNLLLIRD